jgi:predicted enzyme related to lactoylglutathione lyase
MWMMAFKRRQLLRKLLFVFGASCVVTRERPGIAAVAASATPVTGTDTKPGIAATTEMEKVTGIGGLFFRAKDPDGLGRWYQQHLGIALTPTNYEDPVWQQEAGPTVFSPFPETTDYFGDSSKVWMINFRVRDLDKMAAQLRAAGIEVKIDPQTYPNGRFAHLSDPEGNPIELWQFIKPGS